jgi:hypothetical protein
MRYNGEIVKYNKLYDDCLSSIVECDGYIVTSCFNGKIGFLNKRLFFVEREVELGVPIWKVIVF